MEIYSKREEIENYQELSNDYKLEEVPNTNHEEFNDNNIISKK